MKIRKGFVSNSSSSSFIVCGFNEDDSCEVYNILEKKLKEEDPSIEEDDMSWSIYCYLKEHGINYVNHGEWNDTEEIGCILEEGSGKEGPDGGDYKPPDLGPLSVDVPSHLFSPPASSLPSFLPFSLPPSF